MSGFSDLRFRVEGHPLTENQMEKNMEHAAETRIYAGFTG